MNLNTIANLFGKLTQVVFALLATPELINILSIETYGIIGLYTSIVLIAVVLESGMTTSFVKEISVKRSGLPAKKLILSYSRVYFLLGIIACFITYIGCSYIFAESNINDSDRSFLYLMIAISVGLHFPIILYQAGLNGIESQILNNSLGIIFSFFKTLGAVYFLHSFGIHDINTYFVFQIFVQITFLLVIRNKLLQKINYPCKAYFNFKVIKKGYRLNINLFFLSITSVFITQVDRFVLNAFLDEKLFGFFVVAVSVSTLSYAVSTSFYTAVLPKMALLVGKKRLELLNLYQNFSQVLALVLIPTCMFIFFFGDKYFLVWLVDKEASQTVYYYYKLLIIGTIFQGLGSISFAVQLVNTRADIPLKINFIFGSIYIFFVVIFGESVGVEGICYGWALYNIISYLLNLLFTHIKLLDMPYFSFLTKTIIWPFFISAGIFLSMNYLKQDGFITQLASLIGVFVLCIYNSDVVSMLYKGKYK